MPVVTTEANGTELRYGASGSASAQSFARRVAAAFDRDADVIRNVRAKHRRGASVWIDPGADAARLDIPDGFEADSVFVGSNGNVAINIVEADA